MEHLNIAVSLPPEVYTEIKNCITSTLVDVLNQHTQSILIRPRLLTRKEAAEKLRVSLPTLQSYQLKGLLKPQRMGRKVLFDESEVDSILKKSNH